MRLRIPAAAMAVATIPFAALAADAPAIPAGRLLASNCFQCHGTDGKGPGFDRLAGKSEQALYEELVEMRGGGEDRGGLMARHAMGYSDAQLRAIARYLSRVR